ncbi:DUF6233 domain-containing protein [Streptomyces sp. NPDC127037]|uniref:DUF6233 domain-containing protein n=1 Tax=Streptomyces sp. NPDC127037 TaxID=3347113 RepID=UPI0036573905
MYDTLPPDLPQLRTLRTWHAMWVTRLDQAIAAAEAREAEKRRGEQARPPAPEWMIEHGIGQGRPPAEVHQGGCHMAGHRVRPVTRDQARQALGAGIRACAHCRPDTELGLLE